ncbi:hypothetical protein RJT34_28140 [Clitoria ternatea]|uniref:Mitochondrial inner membrane protease ATP23 n=1 Tax=Clitoria ternatea TaxID=43366 RepID=A0AAN9IGQ6_CLITE
MKATTVLSLVSATPSRGGLRCSLSIPQPLGSPVVRFVTTHNRAVTPDAILSSVSPSQPLILTLFFPANICSTKKLMILTSISLKAYGATVTKEATMARKSKTEEEVQAMIQKSFRTPMVRFLRERLEKAGCRVEDNFFKAVNCKYPKLGSYEPGEGVKVCSNYIRIQDEVNQVVIHELIHVFDDCRAANVDWTDCAHHACSEIRANHLSGDCHYKRELLKGFIKIRGHEQECIKRRVLQSLVANANCSGFAAKDSMEAVWDICYNDTQPFDRAP